MKITSTILVLVMAVAAISSVMGCINVKAPEKIEVKSGNEQASTKEIPYGGSKEDWKKFGKGFADAE